MSSSIVVVTAHVGDFVWRCGGAMALHAAQGHKVHLVCLSFGENGESNLVWKEEGSTLDKVKETRRIEALEAAEKLAVTSSEFYDLGDYPLAITPEVVDRLSHAFREYQPSLLITHPEKDPSNLDHCRTFEAVLLARMKAIAPGHGNDFIKPPQVLCFEPHQSELCGFKPNMLLDITSVWEQKKAAMETMRAQRNLWGYYERVGMQRGAQAGRRAGTGQLYGEAYQSIFPSVHASFISN
jgi:4-oxalomesaconate hydratase